jgi:hypothetical protein
VYIGFDPLYHSPFGSHGRTGLYLPWTHVIMPAQWVLARVNQSRAEPIGSMQDLGLNMMRLSDFRRAFLSAGFRIAYFRINQSRHVLMRLAGALAQTVPSLADLLAHNLYCILERP